MRLTIAPDQAGERLDKALATLLPGASLRHRRRLVETGAVLLDGRLARPGVKVRPGQEVEVQGVVGAHGADASADPALPSGVAVLARTGAYAAVTKPAGVHAAHLAGSSGPSVEACLPELVADAAPILLNRLDLRTSGFVLAALTPEAAACFRELEREGRVRKDYLALVHGRLDGERTIRNRLDMAGRARVRVLDQADPDPARHTRVTALEYFGEEGAERGPFVDATLVRAVIARGARHQIRAHLASAGHPIVGDDLYGPESEADSGPGRGPGSGVLYLHHQAMVFEGFAASLDPDWFSGRDIRIPETS